MILTDPFHNRRVGRPVKNNRTSEEYFVLLTNHSFKPSST